MEDKITINGTEYISEKVFNLKFMEEVNKAKENLKKDLVNESQNIELNQMGWSILDGANVMCIVPFNRKEELDWDIIEIKGMSKFKKVEDKDFSFYKIDKKTMKAEGFKLMNNKYSSEFLTKTKKIADLMYYAKDSEPTFYLGYDDKFKEDYPCLIRYNNLIFLLAPRVEED